MAESLKGIIERVTFHNPENGFAVLRVQVTGRRDLVTAVGHLPSAVAGEYIEASGEWVQDREHGLQFRANQLETAPPQSAKGIERYLGSGLVRGIGPHFARKIVEVFGDRTLTVIDESPTYLREVKGIGPRRVQRIREGWQEQKSVRAILMFLQSHGVGNARAVRIYREYGDKAIELVRENPYRLASDIWGVGFQTADQLAQRLGIDRASPRRAQAAVQHVLRRLSSEGHCGFPESAVIERTIQLIDVSADIVSQAIEAARTDEELVRDEERPEPWLYLKPLFLAELGVARTLSSLCLGPHPLAGIDSQAALAWVERKMGFELATAQREAIRQALTQKVLVVTGGPGVGKTTIVRGILDIFSAKHLRCACAPTGRAAKRLAEATGREAKTIHRLLEFDPALRDFKRQRHNPLELDLLVVDETSMVDVVLMNQLLRAVAATACVVLVGDVDQLPSVGPGNVLADIIASEARARSFASRKSFARRKRAGLCGPPTVSTRGRCRRPHPINEATSSSCRRASPVETADRVVALVRERIPAKFGLDPLRDIQVLTPMNRSELGSRNLKRPVAGGLEPGILRPVGGSLRLDFSRRRQGLADSEQLLQGSIQRRPGAGERDRPGRSAAHR